MEPDIEFKKLRSISLFASPATTSHPRGYSISPPRGLTLFPYSLQYQALGDAGGDAVPCKHVDLTRD